MLVGPLAFFGNVAVQMTPENLMSFASNGISQVMASTGLDSAMNAAAEFDANATSLGEIGKGVWMSVLSKGWILSVSVCRT